MRRLIIAIDCDDVLVPSTEHIVNTYNRLYGASVSLEESHSGDNSEWAADPATATRRIHDIQLAKDYGSIAPYDDAVRTCRRLAERHELHLVTARDTKLMGVTESMLDQYFPGVFQMVEHVGVEGDKGDICRRIGANVLIDDNKKHLLSASANGTTGLIWFGNYPWQTKDKLSDTSQVVRCLDWLSVEKEIERLAG